MSFGLIPKGALRKKIKAGVLTVGTFVGMASTIAAEVCAATGPDWILVDLEHGSADEAMVGPLALAAAAYGVPTIVRIESPERIRLGRVLDQGVAGIMIPRVDSVEQVRSALTHLRYPPHGDRGVATYNRSARWGLDPSSLTAEEQETVFIVQIETLDALDAVDDIAALEGVDLLFVGPLDLSFALGVPRQFDHPDYLAALDRVQAAAAKAGKPVGILSIDKDAGRKFADRGIQFIGVGSDSTLLSAGMKEALATVRASEGS